MLRVLVLGYLGSALAQSGCYNAAGNHACNCDTASAAECTGTWTAACGCSRVDPPPPPAPECSTDTAYHLHGGYYIEGVSGVDSSDRSLPNGRRADLTAWTNGTYYPHAEMKLCTGMFCSAASRTVGEAQYLYAHTCAKIRFTYTADSGSDVWEITNLTKFNNCDFTGATQKCAGDAGAPCDVHIEANDPQKVYYYASQATCVDGQKIAVSVSDDFSDNFNQCKGMGAGSSRIQHCDCDHHIRGTTLIEPCFSGFVAGCLADMPEDTSCCPGADASYDRGYVNGGQCIPKSDLEGFKDVAETVYNMTTCNQTKVDAFGDLTECPKVSRWGSAREPVCTMVKEVIRCDVVSPPADCATERNYKLYTEHSATLATPTCPAGTPEKAATPEVVATFTLAGSLSSLTAADKLNVKKAVAKGASVKLSAVSVAFAAGSVVATATIAVADDAAATALTTTLNAGMLASTAALSTALSAEGVTATVSSVGGASVSGGFPIIVIIIIAAVVVVVLLLLVMMMCRNKKKGAMGKGVEATSTSS